jgi:hypothetical protein
MQCSRILIKIAHTIHSDVSQTEERGCLRPHTWFSGEFVQLQASQQFDLEGDGSVEAPPIPAQEIRLKLSAQEGFMGVGSLPFLDNFLTTPLGQFTAIPRTDADLSPDAHIQAIANTAAFHMPTVEQVPRAPGAIAGPPFLREPLYLEATADRRHVLGGCNGVQKTRDALAAHGGECGLRCGNIFFRRRLRQQRIEGCERGIFQQARWFTVGIAPDFAANWVGSSRCDFCQRKSARVGEHRVSERRPDDNRPHSLQRIKRGPARLHAGRTHALLKPAHHFEPRTRVS